MSAPNAAQQSADECPDLARSNSLADLAARIKREHESVSVALKDSVRHAIAAGELLIEAKERVSHGQWLPWLGDNCTMSERSAQVYMRCARNRSAIEDQIRRGVADLSLNQAAAVLMLSSDVRKLLAFAKRVEEADPEDFIGICAAEGIAVIRNNPFGAESWSELPDAQRREWTLWILFGVQELRQSLEEAWYYADRLQSRGWSLSGWYGDEGDKYRERWSLREMPQSYKDDWRAFLETNRDRTLADVENELARSHEARIEARRRAPARLRSGSPQRREHRKQAPNKRIRPRA